MSSYHNRRHFLAGASSAVAACMLGSRSVHAAEPPLETTTIRLRKSTAICFAPLYVVEAFLHAEGFTDIQYPSVELGASQDLVERGELDLDVHFAGSLIYFLDSGMQLTTLGGLHAGCYELFAREPIRTVGDLKGKRIGIHRLNSGMHMYVSIMAAHVGLNPAEDIDWVISEERRSLDMFADGDTDAFLGFPPEPQELRDRGFSRVIINTITDKPWSQYFCCMMYGNRAWVRDHPATTKRFLRAMFKAADYCTTEPKAAARRLVDGGFTKRYDYALETIRSVEYRRWHEYDPEDSLRFYALRLHEGGMIRSSPNTLIAEGANWRFAEELKHELRA